MWWTILSWTHTSFLLEVRQRLQHITFYIDILQFSINENYDKHKKRSCMEVPYSFMTCPGIEPGFTPWEGVVLTAWPSGLNESRRRDSNTRPLRPERSALPNWATPRCSWTFVLRCLPATCIYYHDSEKNASVFWKKCKFLKQIFRNVGRSPEKPYFMRENGISG